MEPDPASYHLRRLRQCTWEGLPFDVSGPAHGHRQRARRAMRRNVAQPMATGTLAAIRAVFPPPPELEVPPPPGFDNDGNWVGPPQLPMVVPGLSPPSPSAPVLPPLRAVVPPFPPPAPVLPPLRAVVLPFPPPVPVLPPLRAVAPPPWASSYGGGLIVEHRH